MDNLIIVNVLMDFIINHLGFAKIVTLDVWNVNNCKLVSHVIFLISLKNLIWINVSVKKDIFKLMDNVNRVNQDVFNAIVKLYVKFVIKHKNIQTIHLILEFVFVYRGFIKILWLKIVNHVV
jgi:hypothetical protein